jgi:2-aminoethylphosphonate-pyruvate transaminase
MTSTIKTAVILAAGKGERLRDVTGNKWPKPMTEVGGKSMIERSIETLRRNGVRRIVIVTGHLFQKIEDLASHYSYVECVFNPKYDTFGSLFSLLITEHHVREAFYLLESDIVYEEKALECDNVERPYIITSPPLPQDDNVYFTSENGILQKLSKEKPKNSEGVMTGIWTLPRGFNQRFARYCREEQVSMLGDYEMAIAQYSRDVEPIHIHHHKQLAWCEVDNEDHLKFAEEVIVPQLN